MDVTRLSDLKPRTVWEITDDAFDMYREHFALLASVSAMVFVPVGLIWTAITVSNWSNVSHMLDGSDTFNQGLQSLGFIIPLFVLGYTFQFAATAVAVRDILLDEPTTAGSVYKRTFKRAVPLFFAALWVAFLSFLGACIAIGPVLVVAYYCFTAHGVVLENRKLVDSVRRSRDMANAYLGRSFGLFFLMAIILGILSLGMEGVIWSVFQLIPQAQGTEAVFQAQQMEQVITTLSNAVVTMLVAPLPAIATTLLYYDLRVRREGLDIEFEAEQWGVPLAPDPFGGVLNPKQPKQPQGRRY